MRAKALTSLTEAQEAFAREFVTQGRHSSLSAVLQRPPTLCVRTAAQYDPVGHLVANADSGMASAFQLYDGPIDKGFFEYDIFFEEADVEWYLRNTPGLRAYEMPMLAFAGQEFWHESTALWHDRTADLRGGATRAGDAVASRGAVGEAVRGHTSPGVWARAFGSDYNFDFGVDIETPTGTVTQSNAMRQRNWGIQAGVDFELSDAMADGQLFLGALVGYGSSSLRFEGTGSTAELSGWSVGAYATYISGGFYVDGLLKADFLNASYNQTFDDSVGETDVRSLGFQLDTGYRIEQNTFFIEPMASLAYVRTNFDDFAVLGNDVSIGSNDSLRGRLGMRVGTTFEMASGRVNPFVSANLWHEFRGNNTASISSIPQASVAYDTGGSWGELGIGADFYSNTSNLTGFVSANWRVGSGVEGARAQIGLRHSW